MANVALTIGVFDGVHRGHAALVSAARRAIGPKGRVVALTFDPHPLTTIKPQAAPARLTTLDQKQRLLADLGADEVQVLEPDPDLLALTPEQFVDRILAPHDPAVIVEGDDFRFGRARAGDIETLRELGAGRGFDVHVVPGVEATLSNQTQVRVSSTIARWLVRQGRTRDCAIILGRPYEITGIVEQGDQRGRTIDCPTANVRPDTLLPADGVYAGAGELPDGRLFPAAISVGVKPTFGEHARALEAHLLGWDGAGAPEYGWPLRLTIGRWLREQISYDSVDALLAQIRRDEARTTAWWRGVEAAKLETDAREVTA